MEINEKAKDREALITLLMCQQIHGRPLTIGESKEMWLRIIKSCTEDELADALSMLCINGQYVMENNPNRI